MARWQSLVMRQPSTTDTAEHEKVGDHPRISFHRNCIGVGNSKRHAGGDGEGLTVRGECELSENFTSITLRPARPWT